MIDALRSSGAADVVALLDNDRALWGTRLLDVEGVGGDALLPSLRGDVAHAFVVVGGVRALEPRRRIFAMLLRHDFTLIDVIHPRAAISPFAACGRGLTAF